MVPKYTDQSRRPLMPRSPIVLTKVDQGKVFIVCCHADGVFDWQVGCVYNEIDDILFRAVEHNPLRVLCSAAYNVKRPWFASTLSVQARGICLPNPHRKMVLCVWCIRWDTKHAAEVPWEISYVITVPMWMGWWWISTAVHYTSNGSTRPLKEERTGKSNSLKRNEKGISSPSNLDIYIRRLHLDEDNVWGW